MRKVRRRIVVRVAAGPAWESGPPEGVDEAKALMADDPFVRNRVFVVEDVAEWLVYVDELSAPAPDY